MSDDKDNRNIPNKVNPIEKMDEDTIKNKKDDGKKIKVNKETEGTESNSICVDDQITCLNKKLIEINSIREQIAKLKVDPAKRTFFTNDMEPLLRTLEVLSLSAERFAIAASDIYGINFTKISELKDILDLIYNVSDTSEEVLKVLNKEIDIMLNIYKCDFKK